MAGVDHRAINWQEVSDTGLNLQKEVQVEFVSHRLHYAHLSIPG